MDLDVVVFSGVNLLDVVIHEGKNFLLVFSFFQKCFICSLEVFEIELWGYNY